MNFMETPPSWRVTGFDRLRLGSSTQQPLMACAHNPMQIGLSKSVEKVTRELDSDNAVIPHALVATLA
jgi:hypothetical protein